MPPATHKGRILYSRKVWLDKGCTTGPGRRLARTKFFTNGPFSLLLNTKLRPEMAAFFLFQSHSCYEFGSKAIFRSGDYFLVLFTGSRFLPRFFDLLFASLVSPTRCQLHPLPPNCCQSGLVRSGSGAALPCVHFLFAALGLPCTKVYLTAFPAGGCH